MKPISFLLLLVLLGSCNYNYWQGKTLEEEGRIEEANIEYHRALVVDPSDDDYQDAYSRTAVKTAEDLLERYRNFLYLGNFKIAYDRLQKARALHPDHPGINAELQKWTHVLIVGKLEMSFTSLKNQLPLADRMNLQVHLNGPNPNETLIAEVHPQNQTFAVEDQIYNANIQLLMSYSLNAVGVQLVKEQPKSTQFLRFVDFKRPLISKVDGGLDYLEPEASSEDRTRYRIADQLAVQAFSASLNDPFVVPDKGGEYAAVMAKDKVLIKAKDIAFLPQMLYLNQKDHRMLLDFGVITIEQKRVGGLWSYKKNYVERREYLSDIQKNLLLVPYFFYREGAYPFVRG